MSESNPYEAPKIVVAPIEQSLDTISDQNLKRLYVKSKTLKRTTFLCILYVSVSLGCLASSFIDNTWLLYPILAFLALLSLVTAFAISKRPSWGRKQGVIFSMFSLILFPVGTVIGVVILTSLLGSERLFGPYRISHSRLNDETLRRKYKTQLHTKPRPNIS
jgi:ABC-type glycerol-3-phosphate transport system permease component